jgi:Co/Zn/Cd efflux system component
LFVFTQVGYGIVRPDLPVFQAMGVVSLLALAANGLCLVLLWKHRTEDVNMRSVWQCSRNDIASNVAVFIAAGGVWLAESAWPDLIVGLALAPLFLHSAVRVMRDALRSLGESKAESRSHT